MPRKERKTELIFNELEMQWKFRSTSPKHVQRLAGIAEISAAETDEKGIITDIEGYLAPSQVRFFGVSTDNQTEHLAKMKARRLTD